MLNKDFHAVLQKEVFQALARCAYNLSLESYLVGGFVRDHILGGEKAKDIDVVTVGSGIELAKAVQNNYLVHKQFRNLNLMALPCYNGGISVWNL